MPPTPPPQSKNELSTRYRNGYRTARFKSQLGRVFIGIGVLSVAIAFIIMLNAPSAPEPLNQTAFEAGRAAGRRARHLIGGPLTVAVVFWGMGTFSCLSGKRLKKTLDTEVNESAFFSQAEKLNLIS